MHSERSIKEISNLLAILKKEKEVHTYSLSHWQTFLDRERVDIAKIGTVTSYVVEKLKQIKVDKKIGNYERLSCSRRLLRLDPSNLECRHFIDSLNRNKFAVCTPISNIKTRSNIKTKLHSIRSKK
jgi:hypothetical protein